MAQRVEPKDSADDFPTPPWATRALLEHVLRNPGELATMTCLESACGAGHMAKVLKEYFGGPVVVSAFSQVLRELLLTAQAVQLLKRQGALETRAQMRKLSVKPRGGTAQHERSSDDEQVKAGLLPPPRRREWRTCVSPRWMSKLGIPRCQHGPSGDSSISRTGAEVADEQYGTRVCRYKPAPGRGAG